MSEGSFPSLVSTSLLFGGAESRCCPGLSSRRGRESRPDEGMQSSVLAEVRAESGSADAVGSIPPRRCSGGIEGSACEMAMGAPTRLNHWCSPTLVEELTPCLCLSLSLSSLCLFPWSSDNVEDSPSGLGRLVGGKVSRSSVRPKNLASSESRSIWSRVKRVIPDL